MSKTERISTYCRICEPQCAMIAHVNRPGERDGEQGGADEEQVIRLTPDKSHPVHKGFACHKGLNFVELHNDPDRNNYPQRRSNEKSQDPEFERVTWDAAIADIAQRLSQLFETHGSDALGFYTGNPSAFNSTGRDASRRFARALGAKYTFGSGTQDCSNKFAASEAVFGTANLHPIPDFAHTEYFLSLGSNPKISHVSFVHMTDPMRALRNIVARGGTVKHVNPRNIESVTPATGELVQINPDTDVYFLAALLNEIHTAQLHNETWIAEHGVNVEILWDFVDRYTADTVAPIVGISATDIRAIAREFATANGASIHMSTGVNMGRQGTLAYWLVQMLSLVTGNLGKRGGNIYSPGFFPAATVGKPKDENPFFDTEFGEIRKIAGSLPGNLLADHIEAGLVKGLVCMSGNPLLSMAGEKRLAKALASLDVLIVIDIYPNATSQFADYILPATDWLERADINSVSIGFQPEPYVQITEPVVKPKYERKEEWWIYARLLQALGLTSPLDDPNYHPLARLDRQLATSDLDVDTIRAAQSGTVTLPAPEPDTLFAVGVQNTEGKVNCGPAFLETGFAKCHEEFDELVAAHASTPDALKLITLRTNYMVNSWLHNLPSLKRDHVLDNPLHMHPEDMQSRGLSDADEVHVKTEYGAVIATTVADPSLKRGVVAMTHGWGHEGNKRLSLASNFPGTNINALLPTGAGSFDKLSNMSHMTGITVELTAVV